MNEMRSSRQFEKECKRNIEVMWLLESLAPDHNAISNFRKDNPKAIKRVFRATVEIARNFGLIAYNIKRILNLIGEHSIFALSRTLVEILRNPTKVMRRFQSKCHPKIITALFGTTSP